MLTYRARMGRELCMTYNKIGNWVEGRLDGGEPQSPLEIGD